MRLKNRFILLISGVFIIPILVSLLSILLYSPGSLQSRMNSSHIRNIRNQIENATTAEELFSAISSLPKDINAYILNDTGEVVYHQNNIPQPTDQVSFHPRLTISGSVELSDGTLFLLFIDTADSATIVPSTVLLAIVAIFLFLSVLSVLTIRSITKSIEHLEKGTKRIAAGDLDTPIIPEGDDTFVNLAESFDFMRKRVKEEQDRQMRFFMAVSHDLKTPLASITGYSEALLDGMATDIASQQKYLRIIQMKGKLLEQRISNLIEYIKFSDDYFRKSLEKRRLVPYVLDFIQLQRDEALLYGYPFEAELAIDEKTEVEFDPILLTRALENLLQNCIRYGMHSKPISMFVKRESKGIVIGFSNYYKEPLGAELSAHMFEPFYRGDHARKGEGTGLGLASVKSIVESHGWTVSGNSDLELGQTIFEILIPE